MPKALYSPESERVKRGHTPPGDQPLSTTPIYLNSGPSQRASALNYLTFQEQRAIETLLEPENKRRLDPTQLQNLESILNGSTLRPLGVTERIYLTTLYDLVTQQTLPKSYVGLSSTSPPAQNINIKIKGDPADLNTASIDAIVALVQKMTGTPMREITIEIGSIILKLNLPYDAAKRLLALAQANDSRLILLGVEEIQLVDGSVPLVAEETKSRDGAGALVALILLTGLLFILVIFGFPNFTDSLKQFLAAVPSASVALWATSTLLLAQFAGIAGLIFLALSLLTTDGARARRYKRLMIWCAILAVVSVISAFIGPAIAYQF